MSNDLIEPEGTPEEVSSESNEVTEQDLATLSEEDLNQIIEGTPDESNEQAPTQPESQEQVDQESVEAPVQEKPEDIEKLRAQVEQQRLFIERRSNEVGHLKTEIKKLIAEKELLVRQNEIDSPVDAIRAERQVERLREQEAALNAEDQKLANQAAFLETVPRHVAPEQFDRDAIIAEFTADGVSPEGIQNFLGALDQQDPALVINVAKRAYYAKALMKLVPITQGLLAERDKWQKKAQNTGETLARNISQQLKRPVSLTSGRPTQRVVSENVNIPNLSLEELNEIITRDSQNGINSIRD